MPCVKCSGCSLYQIDDCAGQEKFNKSRCPIEKRLSSMDAPVKHRFVSREEKDMRPWGRKKVVG